MWSTRYRSPLVLALALGILSTSASAQVVEPGSTQAHLRQLQYFVGSWEFSGIDLNQEVSGTMTFQWDLNRNILIHKIHVIPVNEEKDPLTVMYVILWDAKNKRFLERGYGGYGGYGQAEWTKTEQGWRRKGIGSWVLWNGQEITVDAAFTINNQDQFVLQGTVDKQDEGPFKTDLKVTRLSGKPGGAKAPWRWLLGHWKQETSDGNTGTMYWYKPYRDADHLIGQWQQSDGTRLTEIAGWRPDTQTLVSHAYGSDGQYFDVTFNEVSRLRMKGPFHRRLADGTTQSGTFEIKQVDENTAQVREVATDGTVVTADFQRVDTATDARTVAKEWYKFQAGKWTISWSDGVVVEGTYTRGSNGEALRGTHTSRDGNSNTSLWGWDAFQRRIRHTGYGAQGNSWSITYTKVTPTEMQGEVRGSNRDGLSMLGHVTLKQIDANTFSYRVETINGKGEKVTSTATGIRQTKE